MSSWGPGAPSGALRREEGEAVGHGSRVPTTLFNPDTLSAYLLYIVDSPCSFLAKKCSSFYKHPSGDRPPFLSQKVLP